ncbi:hypothetical protein [Citrobacter werkmanii]|uniref:hypothetical protein n=1 Tax=Citrobacter werkmanii TaxID=67827 RepID=UPI00264D87A9|nr:hypothetical protein [Citrobacter werkmanii]MDN8558377.1 hypothetical protein [Citrobacter werkmanii]
MSNALLPTNIRRQFPQTQKKHGQACSKAGQTRLPEGEILIGGYHHKPAVRLLNAAVTGVSQQRRRALVRQVYGAAPVVRHVSQGITPPAHSGDG